METIPKKVSIKNTKYIQIGIMLSIEKLEEEKQELKDKIRNLCGCIKAIQNDCTHPAATKKTCDDRAEGELREIRYWYHFECPDCKKTWQEDYNF